MNTIKLFFAKIRQRFFNWRVKREMSKRISQPLRNEGSHGHPSRSEDGMARLSIRAQLHARLNLRVIARTTAKLPKNQADAFCYIAYRDLNERIEMYIALAEGCNQSEAYEPQFTATTA